MAHKRASDVRYVRRIRDVTNVSNVRSAGVFRERFKEC